MSLSNESAGGSDNSEMELEEARDQANGLESANGDTSSLEKSVIDDAQPPRRTNSYIQSLPTVEAYLDDGVVGTVTPLASEVVPVIKKPDTVVETEFESTRGVRASLISVSMHKRKNAGLGIRLKLIDGELIVSFVSKDSPLAPCLRPGDRLLGLDDNICSRWTPSVVAAYIAEKLGPLSITVRNPTGNQDLAEAVVMKTDPNSKVGISFVSRNGRLRIKKIYSNQEIGDQSVLSSGDFVTSINEIPSADLDAATAIHLVRGIPKYVSILVNSSNAAELSVRDMRTRYSDGSAAAAYEAAPEALVANEVDIDDLEAGLTTRPSLVSVKISRPSTQVKFGISFRNSDGGLQVSNILDVGILSKSPLKKGMHLVAVNNTYCRFWDNIRALAYFKDATGDILIVAQDPDGDPLQIAAMAYKPSPRSLAGVRLRANAGGIELTKIEPHGIFADSVLNEGDTALSINSMLCRRMTTSEAATFLKHEPSSITIHARTQASTGIILSKFDSASDDRNDSEPPQRLNMVIPDQQEGKMDTLRCA
eukprot:CAMPEP_0117003526 /NCGR_PEP_ID=MMETSP0472-20121206/4808_1 /TAXON_ID=693140 ORGANISM="Tiarina fusus, Strain LIS" /NCGR_SAMPLE_ID=MMETSP0472 /ASSEMBLY_ACC=CAM_ASM_000603 /LENGTH=535 /DNA_ID=CAMNT_0004704187 /DNA_START=185 /DNA_END=1793 /DNA_ORIENTATION=-